MEEGCFAEVFDVGLVVELGVHFNAKVCDNRGEGKVLARESDAGYGG